MAAGLAVAGKCLYWLAACALRGPQYIIILTTCMHAARNCSIQVRLEICAKLFPCQYSNHLVVNVGYRQVPDPHRAIQPEHACQRRDVHHRERCLR